MGHAENDPSSARGGGELERLVEHRDEHVEPFDRELLLSDERPVQVALEAFDLAQPLEQVSLLIGGQRLAIRA